MLDGLRHFKALANQYPRRNAPHQPVCGEAKTEAGVLMTKNEGKFYLCILNGSKFSVFLPSF
jgi:hypothetical protein